MQREHLFKVLVIGDLGVGKTSIIKRYVHQIFSQHYRATIGVDFALKVLNWDNHTVIRLQMWDIAGQERYGNMTRVYYREAVGALIVFDVTRATTFDAVPKWKDDLDTKVTLNNGKPVPVVLLANKSDQSRDGLSTQIPKLETFCKENGFVGCFETSAKPDPEPDPDPDPEPDPLHTQLCSALLYDLLILSGRPPAASFNDFYLQGEEEEEEEDRKVVSEQQLHG
ncbi:ras-related protein Rab-38-like [Silurus asotus]|uniref:Ras-related protein Rab n=1 Tax=Silurus asotus TaxID=30991 RepID=A0AAD5AU30_SILAS|nr:ras-related protein Rab-38-like [Silurus asotus]